MKINGHIHFSKSHFEKRLSFISCLWYCYCYFMNLLKNLWKFRLIKKKLSYLTLCKKVPTEKFALIWNFVTLSPQMNTLIKYVPVMWTCRIQWRVLAQPRHAHTRPTQPGQAGGHPRTGLLSAGIHPRTGLLSAGIHHRTGLLSAGIHHRKVVSIEPACSYK